MDERMGGKMKITAQMTIRDEEFYIGMAIQSVVEKAYGIYILDTGSSDRTTEIVKEYQKKYPNIILEEKSFGGKRKWDIPKWTAPGVPEGYREADARNYTRQRMEEEFPDYNWTILLDADEIVTDRMFSEIERVDKIGATMLGHSTLLPLFPTMLLDEPKKSYFRPITNDLGEQGKREIILFDPHYRAWSRKISTTWGYSKFNHIQSSFKPMTNRTVSPDELHYHFHYSFGPKSIPGWICKWTSAPQGFAASVGILYGEWDIQKHYEEKFPDWFLGGKFKPKKEFLQEALIRCIPMKDPLPDYVVKKWEEWGDWDDR